MEELVQCALDCAICGVCFCPDTQAYDPVSHAPVRSPPTASETPAIKRV